MTWSSQKSISRFARNTVTLLETVRELKTLGVDVYFEEQNIHSLSADGELMLTILASYAQEESRSASENQKWRIKKNFEEGKPWSSTLLGYRNVNAGMRLCRREAETVRMIFAWYLEGAGATAIRNRPECTWASKHGSETRGAGSPILKLLRNYAYTGNLILQTTYREDFITKRKRQEQRGKNRCTMRRVPTRLSLTWDTFNRVQEGDPAQSRAFRQARMETNPLRDTRLPAW